MTLPTRELGDMCLEIDGVVVSESCNKGEVKREKQTEDSTGMHADYETVVTTLGKASIPVTIFLNFGEGSIEELLSEIFEEAKTVEINFRPKKGLASETNPRFRMKEAILTSLPIPVAGPKKLMSVSVEFMNNGQSGVERIPTTEGGESEI
jgi:hypothetical protein